MVTYESRPIGAPGKSPSGAFSSPSGNAHARFLPGRALEEGAPTRPGHSAAVYTASGMLSPFEGSAPVPVKQRSKAYGREAGGRGGTERAVAGHECSSSGRAAPAEGQGRAVGSPHGRHSTSIYGQQPARPLSGQLQQAGASFNRSGGAGRPSSRYEKHLWRPGCLPTLLSNLAVSQQPQPLRLSWMLGAAADPMHAVWGAQQKASIRQGAPPSKVISSTVGCCHTCYIKYVCMRVNALDDATTCVPR